MKLEPQSEKLLEWLQDTDWKTMSAEAKRAAQRERSAKLGGTPPPVTRVQEENIESRESGVSIPIRLYHPAPNERLPILVWFHGGGHVSGDLDTHDVLCRKIALGAHCLVVNVAYRLAPENPFPAAFNDAYDAVRWIAERADSLGGDPTRLAVGGSSAGGNLAAAVCLAAKDIESLSIAYQILVYPMLDAAHQSPSRIRFATGFHLTLEKLKFSSSQYLPEGIDRTTPYASPLFADSVAGLPPAHILLAGCDPLRDDGDRYAERLRREGVPVTLSVYEGVMHGFFSQSGFLEKGAAAIGEVCTVLGRQFAPGLSQ